MTISDTRSGLEVAASRSPHGQKAGGRWIRARLGDVVEINPRALPLPDNFIYIDLECVKNGKILQRNVIRKVEAPSRAQRTLLPDDVLFQLVRPYQQNNLLFKPSDSAEYVASTGYAQIRCKSNQSFFYYLLHRQDFLNRVLAVCTGTGYPAITPTELSKIYVCYPGSSSDQAHIAEILSTCDEVIEKSERAKEKFQRIKEGLLTDLMTRGIGRDGKVRPKPSEAPELYKQSELGLIPKDWEVKRLGDVYIVQLGKMLDAAQNTGEEKLYLGNKAVQWGRIDLDAVEKVRLTESDMVKFRLHKGDMLACEGGEVGRCVIWNDELPECYYQKAIHRLRIIAPESGVVEYLVSLVSWYAANDKFQPYITQTSIAHLPKDKLESMLISWPKKNEQQLIADRLGAVDERIAAEENIIAKYRKIKAGLLQRLLTPPTDAEIVDLTEDKP